VTGAAVRPIDLAPDAGALAGAEAAVIARLRSLAPVAVAFSGGVDSALVLSLAVEAAGARALALTAVSPSLPERELAACRDLARRLGARHELVPTGEVEDGRYAANTDARCYWCKDIVYAALGDHAERHGYGALVDGMNADDTLEHRPGRAAAEEHGVVSPLFEASLGKAAVRALARRRGLAVWAKPAMACLSSRIATGQPVTVAMLNLVEAAEEVVLSYGCRQVRVRVHGDMARIEASAADLPLLLRRADDADRSLRALGFAHVVVDLRPYGRRLRVGAAPAAPVPAT
jgi:uncharacterized protein